MANKLLFKKFEANPRFGKILVTTCFHNAHCADEYILSRKEAAKLALDIIYACGLSADISQMPTQLIEEIESYCKKLSDD